MRQMTNDLVTFGYEWIFFSYTHWHLNTWKDTDIDTQGSDMREEGTIWRLGTNGIGEPGYVALALGGRVYCLS